MTRLEYSSIPLNPVENRNPNNRDPRGPRIVKHALQTRTYNPKWRHSQNELVSVPSTSINLTLRCPCCLGRHRPLFWMRGFAPASQVAR